MCVVKEIRIQKKGNPQETLTLVIDKKGDTETAFLYRKCLDVASGHYIFEAADEYDVHVVNDQ